MRENPISFASIFTKDSSLDPLCSICFFIAPGGWANAGTITHYLAQKVVPKLAQMIPNSNADTISFAIQDSMEEMEEEFGVECQGILTDYNLAICTRAGE